MPRSNIIYIHSHDTGRYIQPYGHAVPTPRLQALAEEGVLFRKAFNAAPTCSPSRAALLTGQSPHSCGQFGLVNRGFELRDRHKHIAHTLREGGYLTVLAGVQHVVRDPATCGYATVLERAGAGDRGAAMAAAAFLAQPHDKPFFLDLGFVATHRDFPVPGVSEDPRYCLPPAPLPDTPATRGDMAAFKASARVLDACVGIVLDAIEQNGLAGNTLVICTTDHGIAFPFMKCNLTDSGTGVMLIVRGPAGFAGGKVIDAMVSHIDLFPTICDITGIRKPDWLEGRSVLPLIDGTAEQTNEQVFSEVNYHCSYEPMRALRTERWKYIRRYSGHGYPMPANIDNSPSKTILMNQGYATRRTDSEELYDLVFDPNETCNRKDDAALTHVLGDLRARLDRWMRETSDPLLSGDIPLPVGGLASRPGDVSPSDIWTYTERPRGYS